MFRRERNLLLAVDDEADFLELIEQIGKGVGCTVITADSAASFREQLSQRQPAFEFLEQCGCDALQGDFIAPSMPASEIESFIDVWNGADHTLVPVVRK